MYLQLNKTRFKAEEVAVIKQPQPDYYSPQHPMVVAIKFEVWLTSSPKPLAFSFQSQSTAARVHQALLQAHQEIMENSNPVQLQSILQAHEVKPTMQALAAHQNKGQIVQNLMLVQLRDSTVACAYDLVPANGVVVIELTEEERERELRAQKERPNEVVE